MIAPGSLIEITDAQRGRRRALVHIADGRSAWLWAPGGIRMRIDRTDAGTWTDADGRAVDVRVLSDADLAPRSEG